MNEASNKIVSVIVVSCGVSDYLRLCLDSLRGQTRPVFEVIVIDNSLNLNFRQEILDNYPFINVYSNPSNLSYCEALNQGIKLSQGVFVLCLNDDVILDNHFIEEALRGFSVESRVGMVSGKILRYDKKTMDSAGLFLSLWHTAKERGYDIKDRGQFQKEEYIFGVNGAVAFYRKEMLENIKEGENYFDPDFHFFYEDLDIAWRSRRNGWKGYYIPQAMACHVRGGSARIARGINKHYARRYLSEDLHGDLVKNRYLVMIKNEKLLDFLLHLPYIILYDLIMWSYILFFRPKQVKIFIPNLRYLQGAFKNRRAKKAG
jgi:GT2 family glycosyltransferase